MKKTVRKICALTYLGAYNLLPIYGIAGINSASTIKKNKL
jgi:hypothetical protein